MRRYTDAATPEDLLGPNGTTRDSILDPYKPYLHQRITDGVTGTNQLLTEIQTRGYQGGERTLRRWFIDIRGRSQSAPVPPPVPPTQDIAAWIMRPLDKLTDEHHTELDRLCSLCPDLAAIRDLAHGFTNLARNRTGDHLTAWVEQAVGAHRRLAVPGQIGHTRLLDVDLLTADYKATAVVKSCIGSAACH